MMHKCPTCGKDCDCAEAQPEEFDGITVDKTEFCTHWMTAGCRPEDLETNLPEEEDDDVT
jgi:hypothetical protein